MKSLLVLRINIKHLLALILAIVLLITHQDSQAAWSDQHLGQDLVVHYVYLTGYGGSGDRAAKRKALLSEHKSCTEFLTALGKPAKPLPAEGVPNDVDDQEMEIYSSANRVLVLTQGHLHSISRDDCSLKAIPNHFFKLYSALGKCEVDLIRKEAIGKCNSQEHERAPASQMVNTLARPNIDLSKLPPQVRAQLKRLKQPQGGLDSALTANGAHKSIAGYPCQSYRSDLVRMEVCVAMPTGASASPFPIPASPFNGDIPGLLLETKSPFMTLHAEQVRMNLPVPNSLFAIPKGVKIKPWGGQ